QPGVLDSPHALAGLERTSRSNCSSMNGPRPRPPAIEFAVTRASYAGWRWSRTTRRASESHKHQHGGTRVRCDREWGPLRRGANGDGPRAAGPPGPAGGPGDLSQQPAARAFHPYGRSGPPEALGAARPNRVDGLPTGSGADHRLRRLSPDGYGTPRRW